jgi:hypothetical protein
MRCARASAHIADERNKMNIATFLLQAGEKRCHGHSNVMESPFAARKKCNRVVNMRARGI